MIIICNSNFNIFVYSDIKKLRNSYLMIYLDIFVNLMLSRFQKECSTVVLVVAM